MNKLNLGGIASFKKISMKRAFSGDYHKSIKSVALHVGVPSPLAKAFLLHLIKTKQLSESNRFLQGLRVRNKRI